MQGIRQILLVGLFVGVLAGMLLPGSAGARAIGVASCSVNTTPVNFGIYWGNAVLNSTGTITVTCSLPATTTVQLDNGQHVLRGFATRKMAAANGNTLSYNLFTDAGHTLVWGDGTIGSRTVTGSKLTVYGQMPAAQKANPGSYSDSVLVTIIW